MIAETFQWIGLVIAWIGYAVYCMSLHVRIKRNEIRIDDLATAYNSASRLLSLEIERKKNQLDALKRLTDPASIEEDMEKGARMREMYDANRTTLPREDAGPPAKIYSLKLRAKVPKAQHKTSED